MKNYTELALRTELKDYDKVKDRYTTKIARLTHAVTGICTESGEFLDMLKKHVNYGKPFDKVNAVEEIGDILWYIAIACDELDISLEAVMYMNIEKLKTRYPEKYTDEKAINRDVDKERNVLEFNKGE